MRNFNFVISLLTLSACQPEVQIDFNDVAQPAILSVSVTQVSPASCPEFGELAKLTISASQGEAELNQLNLSRQVNFGQDAELSWTDSKHVVVWRHKPLFPRQLTANRETERLQVTPGDPVVFTLSIDPSDCRDFDSQAIVESVNYWDVATKKNVVQKIGP